VSGQQHSPAALYPRERPGTHYTEGWVGPRAGLDGRKISSPPSSIPDSPAHCQSLCRLNYPTHTTCGYIILFTRCSLEVTTCFGHHQVVYLIQGNYTMCDIKSLVFNEISFSSIKKKILQPFAGRTEEKMRSTSG